jgi:hypothetical protein
VPCESLQDASIVEAAVEEWTFVALLAKEHQADRPRVPVNTAPSRHPLAEIEYWKDVTASLASFNTQVITISVGEFSLQLAR